ncbi:hypothetical protein CCP3SC15_3840002 [Gammaproteobacteria bacterium]
MSSGAITPETNQKFPFKEAPQMNDLMTTQNQGGALAQAESNRAIAEVQAAMILARQFPRDEQRALDKMLVAFQRQGLAEAALYSYSKGGTEVSGPSIRAAEAIAQNWGNLQFGIRELSQQAGESTVEAFAWDVETNVRQIKVFQVPHVRSKRTGNVKLTDPRDIYELVANQGARRLRACILGVIPGDIIEAVVDQTDTTLKAKADTSPAALKKLEEAFSTYGVTKEMLEKKIQRRIDAITPAQIVSLRKIYNSLRDGMSQPSDWFEGLTPEQAHASKAAATVAKVNEAAAAAKPAADLGDPATCPTCDTILRANGTCPECFPEVA